MTNSSARLAARIALVGVLGAVCLCGCSSLSPTRPLPWKKMPLDASTGFYQSASIEYRLDAGKLQQPLDVAHVEGQRIWFEKLASSPLEGESTGTLSIIYPHPQGKAEQAQVKFVLESRSGAEPKNSPWLPVHVGVSVRKSDSPQSIVTSQSQLLESWVLDIPSSESDAYFKLLGAQSFYDTERPESGAAEIAVNINGKRIEKPWDQIPELNLLVQRVRRQGQLVALVRPANAPRPITSVDAYQQVAVRTGSPPPSGDLALQPFSMGPAAAVPPFTPPGGPQLPAATMARSPGISR